MRNRIPDVIFKTRVRNDDLEGDNPFEWKDLSSDEIFKGRNVVLFALPGAFTPVCSNNHLPRYEELYGDFLAEGVDAVICLSVNDTFVMYQWGLSQGVQNVFLLPDGNAEFTRKMGMLVNMLHRGYGQRSWRYSMYVEDGEIKKLFSEAGFADNNENPVFEVSDADTMLAYLKSR